MTEARSQFSSVENTLDRIFSTVPVELYELMDWTPWISIKKPFEWAEKRSAIVIEATKEQVGHFLTIPDHKIWEEVRKYLENKEKNTQVA